MVTRHLPAAALPGALCFHGFEKKKKKEKKKEKSISRIPHQAAVAPLLLLSGCHGKVWLLLSSTFQDAAGGNKEVADTIQTTD